GSRLRLEQLQPRRQPFPYTTLFRSSNVSRQTFGSNRPILQSRNFFVEMTIVELLVQRLDTSIDIALPNDRPIGLFLSKSEARPVDRKSTRLNSSHVSISHAASCLKKKKPSGPTRTSRMRPSAPFSRRSSFATFSPSITSRTSISSRSAPTNRLPCQRGKRSPE